MFHQFWIAYLTIASYQFTTGERQGNFVANFIVLGSADDLPFAPGSVVNLTDR